MKIIIAILFFAFASPTVSTAQAFTSTADSAAHYPITVVLPKKAIWRYAFYISENPREDTFAVVRKMPDVLKALCGSKIREDSLITVTVKARNLATYLQRIQGEQNGKIRDHYRSVVLNLPSIPNYTSLQNQILSLAQAGNAAALYVRSKFQEYEKSLDDLETWEEAQGKDWIYN